MNAIDQVHPSVLHRLEFARSAFSKYENAIDAINEAKIQLTLLPQDFPDTELQESHERISELLRTPITPDNALLPYEIRASILELYVDCLRLNSEIAKFSQ